MDNMKIATSSDRKITISTLVSWIVSIFLIIVAMGAFPKSVPGASLILLSGIILLPSVITLITNKFNVSSFGRLRMIAAIVLFLAGMSLVPSTVKNSNVSTLEQKLAAEVTTVENTQVASNVDTTQAKEVVQNNFIFDVPSLLHKNIDEVISVLGVPKDNSELTSEQMKLGDDKWSKEFEKNGYTIGICESCKCLYLALIKMPVNLLESFMASTKEVEYCELLSFVFVILNISVLSLFS